MLTSLAKFSFRNRLAVLLTWVALLVGLNVVAAALGGADFRTTFNIPGAESVKGLKILTDKFPSADTSGFGGQVVFVSDKPVTDPAVQGAMTKLFEGLQAEGKGKVFVASPYTPEGAQQVAPQGTYAGRLGYAQVAFPSDWDQTDFLDYATKAEVLREEAEKTGVRVEYGGQAFAEFEPPESEIFGLVAAIFILLLAFGSVLAMGLPIGTALLGIFSGVAIVTMLSRLIEMPDFTTLLAIMIGLGVGIDYALFIVTRYRDERHLGRTSEEATITAIDTAGRAVIFAGITVMISLLGMFLMGLAFVRGLAIGASIAVLFTMLVSVTLLPALLGLAGDRIEVTRIRGLVAVASIALFLLSFGLHLSIAPVFLIIALLTLVVGGVLQKMGVVGGINKQLPPRKVKPLNETVWYRWSRFVEHRPWPVFLAGALTLGLLSIPVLSLRLGTGDTGNYGKETTTRQAYDLLAEGFGPGSNGPLLVVGEVPEGTSPDALLKVTAALGADANVAFASPPTPSPKGGAVQWFVIPKSSPQDVETDQLVKRLRTTVLPAAVDGTGVATYVTGASAVGVDFASFISRRMPVFIGGVLLLSFLLLMAVFRSVLVPLKAVIMNLLSIGAAYGVIVAVFQWGWGAELIGVGKAGPIEPWAPMMLFAIVFGLSMDYEVFLLSRMREEFDRTGDNASAVADGLASTARVITAAAAIMVFVFGSFLLEADRQIKLFGMGLAVAVLLDATVVRMLLVPATMELLGAKNWWMPKWLDRIIPKLNVEGGAHHNVPTNAVTGASGSTSTAASDADRIAVPTR
jgi:putative drug exporter of the RND superfamily